MKKIKNKFADKVPNDVLHTVVKFVEENNDVSFDCIPDIWFKDEYKEFCYWPPLTGRNVALRALKLETPEDTWTLYPCEVVKGGFRTYSAGRVFVREKAAQRYNTSSAEEHATAALFRREHPGLITRSTLNFNEVFSNKKSAQNKTEEKSSSAQKSPIVDPVISVDTQIPQSATDSMLSGNLSPASVISVRAIPSPMRHNSNVGRTTSESRSTQIHRSRSRERRESSTKSIPSPIRHNSNVGRKSESRSTHTHRSRSRDSSMKSIPSPMRHSSNDRRRSESRSIHTHRSSSRSRDSSMKSIPSPMRHNLNVGRRSESGFTQIHRSRSRQSSMKSLPRRSVSRSAHSQRSSTSVSRGGSISDSCSSRSRDSSRRKNKSDSNGAVKLPAPLRQNRGSASNSTKIGASVLNGNKHSRNSKQKKVPMKPQNKRYERISDQTCGNISLPSAAYQRDTVNSQKSPQNHERMGIRSGSRSCGRYSQESEASTSSVRLQKEKYNRFSKQTSGAASLPYATGVQLPPVCSSSCQSQSLLKNIYMEMRSLTKTVVKHQHQSDRRLVRMEVSINKTLVRLGDITRSNAVNLSDDLQRTSHRDYSRGPSTEGPNRQNSGQSVWDECRFSQSGPSSQRQDHRAGEHLQHINHGSPRSVWREQRSLEVPIKRLSELAGADLKLQHREFFTFLLNQEIEFCMPGENDTKTVVVTNYLKRFISLRVRCLLTLKDTKKNSQGTLYYDYYNVYNFLITVMCQAYKSCKKCLTPKEAHEALRIVWGRSKQLMGDEERKLK